MPKASRPSGAQAANRVRIVGGALRSRLLKFPSALQLRPTPDRVRETLFNWLGQDLTGKTCLDLFAGSGALGFEAVSRGARSVVMVERDRTSHAALVENRDLLQADAARIVQSDALEFLRKVEAPYDVVFLDPPYAFTETEALLTRLQPHLAPDALVYREGAAFLAALPGWIEHRSAKAGAVHYQLLKVHHG